jgi:hypothetical protein
MLQPYIPGQFDFLSSLITDMTQDDPSKRPVINDVVSQWDVILKSLTTWKLRSRLVPRDETFFGGSWSAFGAFRRRVWHGISRKAALPKAN